MQNQPDYYVDQTIGPALIGWIIMWRKKRGRRYSSYDACLEHTLTMRHDDHIMKGSRGLEFDERCGRKYCNCHSCADNQRRIRLDA